MAERRMFAKTIIKSDTFLDMPVSARMLYFYLMSEADDDGFVNNPKTIIRYIGASSDDMNVLILKKFVLNFDDGIVVIKHWRIHNYIRSDRYVETKYKEHKNALKLDENKAYSETKSTLGIPNGYQMDTQDRLGKDRIGKDRLDKDNTIVKTNFDEYVKIYNTYCTSLPKIQKLTEKRKSAIKKFEKEFNKEQFEKICKSVNDCDFLIGKNDTGWKADFDFILRTDKATSILEGKYQSRDKKNDINKIKSKTNNFDEKPTQTDEFMNKLKSMYE